MSRRSFSLHSVFRLPDLLVSLRLLRDDLHGWPPDAPVSLSPLRLAALAECHLQCVSLSSQPTEILTDLSEVLRLAKKRSLLPMRKSFLLK